VTKAKVKGAWGSVWGRSGDALGMFWGCSGDVLGRFWGSSGACSEGDLGVNRGKNKKKKHIIFRVVGP